MATEGYEKLMTDLKNLRLPAMAEMLDSYAKQAASSSMSYVDFLGGLVSEEVSRKEQRSVQNRIKSARFPVLKSLDDFDYAFQPSIDRKKVGELSNLRFIDNKENILFLGPSGVGKTHLSTGLGVRACESGYKVLFTTLNDMVSVLMASMADNSCLSRSNPAFFFNLIGALNNPVGPMPSFTTAVKMRWAVLGPTLSMSVRIRFQLKRSRGAEKIFRCAITSLM